MCFPAKRPDFCRLPILALALMLPACGSDSAGPSQPVMDVITVTDQEHHLGDNPGAAGVAYESQFQLPTVVDSAFVSITFLYPNAAAQSGPEIENPPKVSVNATEIGLGTTDFPDNPLCVTGSGPDREYSCNLTVVLTASATVVVGTNAIRVESEAATGGDDDFVFSDLLVIIWR